MRSAGAPQYERKGPIARRRVNRTRAALLPYMTDDDGKLRRFKFERFKAARDAYRNEPTRARAETYFLEALPVISYTFTKLWNTSDLIEKDHGWDPAEIFAEVAATCAVSIRPGKVYEWHGSRSWAQFATWTFWKVHAKNAKEVKIRVETGSIDPGDIDSDCDDPGDIGTATRLRAQRIRESRHRATSVISKERRIDAFMARIFEGRYPWRTAPDICQYLAVTRLSGGVGRPPRGAGTRHCDYLWKYSTPDKARIDFLSRYVEITIRRELLLLGGL